MKRDGQQGAGVESGLSKKEKIGEHVVRESDPKHFRPKSPPVTPASGGHKIK